jgi:hypothetical protein
MDEESVTGRASYARFGIGVENRDSHHLSQFEIDGGKRISQHLSGLNLSHVRDERVCQTSQLIVSLIVYGRVVRVVPDRDFSR